MKSYAALLRGIGPGNPNMRNDKLRGVFESLGFKNVRTVISSGNVLFESDSSDTAALEAKIEAAFPKQLGFNSSTIIRSKEDLQKIVGKNVFKGLEHSTKTSLNVTFLKAKQKKDWKFPYQSQKGDYTLLAMHGREIFSVIDLTTGHTPDLMTWLEKQFGKQITTRTNKTVERILKKFD